VVQLQQCATAILSFPNGKLADDCFYLVWHVKPFKHKYNLKYVKLRLSAVEKTPKKDPKRGSVGKIQ